MIARHQVAFIALAASMLVAVLPACTALKTFPQAAKAGDTVALAVGSADGMSRANTTASYESDSNPGVFYDLTTGIRGIFRLYADKASGLYNPESVTRYIVDTSGHEPWVTVMVIDLPQGLPVGTGKVNINTTASYPTIGSDINDVPIDLEILPGTGVVDDLRYEFGLGANVAGDLTLLEPQLRAVVMPPFPESTAWPSYGAIEMKLHVPTSAVTGMRIVADDIGLATGSNRSMLTQRDATNDDLTIVFTSLKGKLRSYEPRFAIVLTDPSVTFSATPTIASVSYFDIDGNSVAGPLVSDYTVQVR